MGCQSVAIALYENCSKSAKFDEKSKGERFSLPLFFSIREKHIFSYPTDSEQLKKDHIFPSYAYWNDGEFSYFCSMHRFIEYISDLLFLHDCVIIPDFGGFICNYKSAFIDEDSGLICPPTKDILFNRNLTHNDGLLVNWIASKENITYDKATTQLTLFCEDLKIRLNQKQRVAFGDIGVFFTDRRFNIIFEPGKSNFFAEAYGMEPIAVQPTEAVKSQPVQISMPTATAPDMSAYINMESSGNILHRLLKYALAVAAVAGVAVITQLDIFHSNSKELSGKIANNTTIQPELPTMPSIESGKVTCNSVISPAHDYVDYDPVNDLRW